MKKGRFTEEQIIGVLKQHEAGRKVPEFITISFLWLPGAESAARIGIATAKAIQIINALRIRKHVQPQSKPLPIAVAAE